MRSERLLGLARAHWGIENQLHYVTSATFQWTKIAVGSAPRRDILQDFILTPHVAWASDAAMQALAGQLIDNIEAFVRGEPRNVVA